MLFSVCLVTRNHGQTLERAIHSVAGLAPDLVVADTGSTDDTVEVAGRCGARVVPVMWEDDFAAASNTALDAAVGDWVLWLNPDEHLAPAGVAAVATAVADPGAFAFSVNVQQETRPDRPGFGPAGPELRLFRRDPAVRWVGRLHPRFDPPLAVLAARRGMTVGTVAATVHRHAYLSPITPDKLRWAVRLLELELRDRPGQLPYQIEYGRHLLWLNDPKGHEVLAAAANEVWTARHDPQPPTPWVGPLFEYLLTVSDEQSRFPLGRDEVRAMAAKWCPDSPPVLWALANERYRAKDYRIAAELLNRLLSLGQAGATDAVGGFDPAILGPKALLNLAWCHLHLGEWLAAKTCVQGLLADPDYRQAAARVFGLAEQQTCDPVISGGNG